MLQTLTIKFPSPLMRNIKEKSHQKKISRGAFVREALVHYMSCVPEGRDHFNFMKVTHEILKGKKKKRTNMNVVDKIREHFRTQPFSPLSAEEEIRRSRTRGLL